MNSKSLRSIFADTHLFILNLTAVFHITVAIVLRFGRIGAPDPTAAKIDGGKDIQPVYGFWYAVTTIVLMLGGVILFAIIEFLMHLEKRQTCLEVFCPFLFNGFGKSVYLLLLTSMCLETVGTTEVVLAISLFVMVGLNIGKGIVDGMVTKGMLIESEEEEDFEANRPKKSSTGSVHPKKTKDRSDNEMEERSDLEEAELKSTSRTIDKGEDKGDGQLQSVEDELLENKRPQPIEIEGIQVQTLHTKQQKVSSLLSRKGKQTGVPPKSNLKNSPDKRLNMEAVSKSANFSTTGLGLPGFFSPPNQELEEEAEVNQGQDASLRPSYMTHPARQHDSQVSPLLENSGEVQIHELQQPLQHDIQMVKSPERQVHQESMLSPKRAQLADKIKNSPKTRQVRRPTSPAPPLEPKQRVHQTSQVEMRQIGGRGRGRSGSRPQSRSTRRTQDPVKNQGLSLQPTEHEEEVPIKVIDESQVNRISEGVFQQLGDSMGREDIDGFMNLVKMLKSLGKEQRTLVIAKMNQLTDQNDENLMDRAAEIEATTGESKYRTALSKLCFLPSL